MAETAPTVSYGSYASAAGSVASIVGQIYSAVQASRMGEYNAQVAQNNAQAAAYQAQVDAYQQERLAVIAAQEQEMVAQAAAFKEARFREQFALLQGEAAARFGASGLAPDASPLFVMEENLRQAEMQIAVNNYNARLQQRALGEEVTQRNYAADLARYGIGERLRVGAQQAGLAAYAGQAQSLTNALGAFGEAAQAGERFAYNTAREDYFKRRGLYGSGTGLG